MSTGGISLAGAAASPQIALSTASLSSPSPDASTPSTNDTLVREQQAGPVDTVTIMNKILNSKHETEKKEAKQIENKRENQPFRTMKDVLFAYNFRGDLRIKFTDSASKLVYQIPSVLVARMTDLLSRPASSVNTKA